MGLQAEPGGSAHGGAASEPPPASSAASPGPDASAACASVAVAASRGASAPEQAVRTRAQHVARIGGAVAHPRRRCEPCTRHARDPPRWRARQARAREARDRVAGQEAAQANSLSSLRVGARRQASLGLREVLRAVRYLRHARALPLVPELVARYVVPALRSTLAARGLVRRRARGVRVTRLDTAQDCTRSVGPSPNVKGAARLRARARSGR